MSYYMGLERFGEHTALLGDDGARVSYAALAAAADTLAGKIPGERALVFILCRNSIPSITAYLACLRGGHVPLLLDENINDTLLDELIRLYTPGCFIAPAGRLAGEATYTFGDYALLPAGHSAPVPMAPELALLLTTSGSTGSPKLVRLSAANLDANTQAICQYLEIDAAQRPITTLPMNYTYGLSILNSHLAAGACILVTGHTLMQREFWDFLKAEKATSFGGVPYTYEMLKRLRFFRMELPSLECLTQAGGKLNRELTREVAEYCEKNHIRFYVMYGQTEATARMSYLPYRQALQKCGSMGIAIPGGRFTLLDTDGNTIDAADTPGELVYEGPNVSLGYAESAADLALPDENHGVLHTGDIATRDADGYYTIVGRKKRFIKIFGNRVNLDEVEQLLQNKGFSCACTGVDDKMLVATENAADVPAIEATLPGLLGLNRSAFVVRHLAQIPKNEAGKTIYAELLEVLYV